MLFLEKENGFFKIFPKSQFYFIFIVFTQF